MKNNKIVEEGIKKLRSENNKIVERRKIKMKRERGKLKIMKNCLNVEVHTMRKYNWLVPCWISNQRDAVAGRRLKCEIKQNKTECRAGTPGPLTLHTMHLGFSPPFFLASCLPIFSRASNPFLFPSSLKWHIFTWTKLWSSCRATPPAHHGSPYHSLKNLLIV